MSLNAKPINPTSSSSSKVGLFKPKDKLSARSTPSKMTTVIHDAPPSSSLVLHEKKSKVCDKTRTPNKNKNHKSTVSNIKSRTLPTKTSTTKTSGNPKVVPLALTSGVKKLSIEKAKATRERAQKKEKLLDQVSNILARCEVSLETLDQKEIKHGMEELQKSFEQINSNFFVSNAKIAEKKSRYLHSDAEKSKETKDTSWEEKIKKLQKVQALKDELWEEKMSQIRKAQAAFKRKLDKLTTTIKTVGLLKEAVSSLKEDSINRDYKTSAFRKRFCIAMKYNFDPLFNGSIGTEGSSNRTESMNNNLSKTVWDSKTSKPGAHPSR